MTEKTNEQKKLWRFHWDCGRAGELEGLFVATGEEISSALGKRVYFGEALGKHSDIQGTLKGDELSISSADPAIIEWFESEFTWREGARACHGHCPLDCLEGE